MVLGDGCCGHKRESDHASGWTVWHHRRKKSGVFVLGSGIWEDRFLQDLVECTSNHFDKPDYISPYFHAPYFGR